LETTRTAFDLTFSKKFPDASEVVPFVVPFSVTEAAATGSFLSSIITPFKVFCWQRAAREGHTNRHSSKTRVARFFINRILKVWFFDDTAESMVKHQFWTD
jgi:hypothetical protein